jgi:hypothetical protein
VRGRAAGRAADERVTGRPGEVDSSAPRPCAPTSRTSVWRSWKWAGAGRRIDLDAARAPKARCRIVQSPNFPA